MENNLSNAAVLDIEHLALKAGAHSATSGEMCVMEAVAFVAGEKWSDSPECASPVIAAFLRSYNDAVDDETRQSLKPFIIKMVGTRGDEELESRRATIACDWLVRVHTPAWLRLAGLSAEADALASLPEIIDFAKTPSIKAPLEAAKSSASAARDAAGDAARAAARDAAGDAAWAAARDAAGDAAWAAARAAARDAAWAAARAAARDAAGDAAWAAARDAAGDAARDAAGDAARDAAGDAAWDAAGDAAWAAARAAARAAAGDALKPTVKQLQATIPALIQRMIDAK